jgi:SAM-dependent methyltransferase
MMSQPPIDPRQRFTSRVQSYVAARPHYPAEVVTHLRVEIGLTSQWNIADLGCGTGISSELFLNSGNAVVGVEPNAGMRQAAEKSLAGFDQFRAVDGSAEATTLPDHCADLVVAAQAFHWFDPAKTRAEAQRILRRGGWALLMWNNRKLSGTPFLESYEQLLISLKTDYLRVRHNNIDDADLAAFFGADDWSAASFPNQQSLDFAGLRDRVISSSYTPPPGDPRHQPMLVRLRELFDQHQHLGRVTIEYETEIYFRSI